MHPVTRLFTCLLTICSASQAAVVSRQSNNTNKLSTYYYDVEGREHAERANSLISNGYRIISLSAYGSGSQVKYAAVWAEGEGTSPEMIQDADEATYNSWFSSWKSKGYVSTQVAVTGPVDNAVYAGVMEQLNITNWAQICDLTNAYGYGNYTGGTDMFVKGYSMYGTPENRRYCVLGHENVGNQQSTIFYPVGQVDFDKTYRSETKKRFWRPSHLYISDDHIITPQFVDTDVGNWVAKVNLTASQLATEINTQKSDGLVPIDIQGGSLANTTLFNAIFAEKGIPSQRQWSTTGAVTGFQDNKAAEAELDDIMRSWMVKNGVRQAQVAIAANGTVLTERGFTWAESNRAVVKPDDLFLLASVSKMFVYSAIYELVQASRLNYSTLVYPMLGYQPVDERANVITIQHLLDHAGGYDRGSSGDPMFMFREIANVQLNGERAATMRDVIEYMVDRRLDFTPGESESYSNYGTMLLSYVVSNITETPYLEFLEKKVFNGLDVRLYETALEKHLDDSIVQESKYTSMDPVHPKSSELVPGPYGGDGAIKEECEGSFSLAASASTIAKFIGNHAVYGIGERQVASWRDGTLMGARTYAISMSDVDLTLNLNTREFISEYEFDDLRFTQLPQFVSRNGLQ